MSWTLRTNAKWYTAKTEYIYTTEDQNTYTFLYSGALGQKFSFETPIHFTSEEWQIAIDRGLGTHATSIVTRCRAQLGKYISAVEQEYGHISLAPDAQRKKCKRIKKAQIALKQLESIERTISPSNLQNGPLQEERFKARVQKILFNLRKKLVTVDRNTHSAMLGRADQIVADAISDVDNFHWPFAIHSPETIELNTRRQNISAEDQLNMPHGGVYQALHEFPDGLSLDERNRLLNVIYFKNPNLKRPEFKSMLNTLPETHHFLTKIAQLILMPIAFILSPLVKLGNMAMQSIDAIDPSMQNQWVQTALSVFNAIRTSRIGIGFNLLLNEPYQLLPEFLRPFDAVTSMDHIDLTSETIAQKLASETHAERMAYSITPEQDTFFSQVHNKMLEFNAQHPDGQYQFNKTLTERRILWNLCLQNEAFVNNLTTQQKTELAIKLAPNFSINGLNTKYTQVIAPEQPEGTLFARGSVIGSIHASIDPLFTALARWGRRDPIMSSSSILLWGIKGLYLGAASVPTAVSINLLPIFTEDKWLNLISMIGKVPGISASLTAVLRGPLSISDSVSTVQNILLQLNQELNKSQQTPNQFQMDLYLETIALLRKTKKELLGAEQSQENVSTFIVQQFMKTEVFLSIRESDKIMFKQGATATLAKRSNLTSEYDTLSDYINNHDFLLKEEKETLHQALNQFLPMQAMTSKRMILSELQSLYSMLGKQNPLTPDENTTLKALLPAESTLTKSFDLNQFLYERYPELVACYGGKKESHENGAEAWNNGLYHALHESYFNEIIELHIANPNIWTVLKQYPSIVHQFSNHSSTEIDNMRTFYQRPSGWMESLFITPFRALHGLVLGALIGLPASLYYSFNHQPFPDAFREYSGYNNLLGIVEALPYLASDLTRAFTSLNESLLHAKARIYDTAMTVPKNLKGIPGFIGSFALATPLIFIDACIAIPSLLWNLCIALGFAIVGKPQRLGVSDYIYKLPVIGVIAEALLEKSFEDRATRRIIQHNQDVHELFGVARSITTGRAGDISSYRKSSFAVQLITPSTPIEDIEINTIDLLQSHIDYTQHKSIFFMESYIMAKIAEYAHQANNDHRTLIKESSLLQFIFQVEAEQLKKQFKLKHIRAYHNASATDLTELNKLCDNAVYASLKPLLEQELLASKDSETFNALIDKENFPSNSEKKASTETMFKHMPLQSAGNESTTTNPSTPHPSAWHFKLSKTTNNTMVNTQNHNALTNDVPR